jgi:hypothetical protein
VSRLSAAQRRVVWMMRDGAIAYRSGYGPKHRSIHERTISALFSKGLIEPAHAAGAFQLSRSGMTKVRRLRGDLPKRPRRTAESRGALL